MSDDIIIKKIDKALQRYYNQFNGDYTDNQFVDYCEDNGFDDEAVEGELKADPDDCMLLDFDEDNFPFDKQPKNKNKAIFDIIMKCYTHDNAYSGEMACTILKEYFHFDEKEMIEITKKYEKYCDAIFLKANAGGDQALHKILYISDNKIGEPYLRLLADLYARDRIKYNFLIPKIKEEYKNEINKLLVKDQDNIIIKQLTHQTWAELNTHTKKIKNWNNKHKEFQLLLSALYSFYFRVCNLRDLSCSYKIDDNYMTICEYISAAVDFVYNLAENKIYIENQSICPFQYDFCMAFDNVNCHEAKVSADQKEDYSDDDDDDDDDIDDNIVPQPPQDLIFNGDQNLDDVDKRFREWAEKHKIDEKHWYKIWETYIIIGDIKDKLKKRGNINKYEQLIQHLGGYFDCFGNIKQRLKDENMFYIAEKIEVGQKVRFKTQFDKLRVEIKPKLKDDEKSRKQEFDEKKNEFDDKKEMYNELKRKYDLINDDKMYKKKKDELKETNDKKLRQLLKSVDEYKKDKEQFDKYKKELAGARATLTTLEEESKKDNKKDNTNAINKAKTVCETVKKKCDPYEKKFDEGIYGKEMRDFVHLKRLIYEIKELEIQKCNDNEINQYPRRFRFISVLDRREENKENDSIENDELIFFEASRNSFKLPPEEMKCDNLWYFHSSKKNIIPKCKNYNEDDKDKKKQLQTKIINTDHAMKHGMLLFSFHVDAIDEIRCYLYYGSQMVRFLPEDLKLYLPSFFDTPEIDAKGLDFIIDNIKSKLVDEKFNAFYNEYQGDDEIMKRDIKAQMETIIDTKKKEKRASIKSTYERIQKYSDLYARDLIDYYYKNNEQLSLEKWALVVLKDAQQELINEVNNFYAKCKLLKPGIKNIKINYDYKLIYKHIYDAINFVYKLSKTNNRPCPFQYDCCFIFDTENDCFGDIKARLNNAQLIYESETIKNSSSFETLYKTFIKKVKKEEPNGDKQYPRRFRFLSVFDGRKRNKNKNELIFFGSSKKTKPYNIGHTDDKCEGEWYFEQTCIIPNHENDSDNNESKTNEINICNPSINNGMLVLSFHVEGCDDNRCYLYLGGKMVRMLPTDLNTFLPELFVNNTSNKKEVEKLIKDIDDNGKLYHKQASKFATYNGYGTNQTH